MYISICPSWCEFLLLLRPCIIVIVYRQFEMFDRIDTYLIVWNVRMYVNRETEKEKRRLKKLILSFRVSRCQRVMFYLKENNLRYWSGGVCLTFFTSRLSERAFKWSNTCQHNSILSFLLLYISTDIVAEECFKWCIVMHCWFLFILLARKKSLRLLSSFILVSHKCHSIISVSIQWKRYASLLSSHATEKKKKTKSENFA